MKQIMVWMAMLFVLCTTVGWVFAAEGRGTPEEAQAMVKKAIAAIQTEGKEKVFAQIDNPKGPFIEKDLFLFVYDMKGRCLAHGNDSTLVGQDLIDLQDPDGTYFVKEFVKIAQTQGSGWVTYKWPYPSDTRKITQKSSYIEKYDDLIVGCGSYT